MNSVAHHVWRKARITKLTTVSPEYNEQHRVSGWALLPLGILGAATIWAWTAGFADQDDTGPAAAGLIALISLVGALCIRVVIAVDQKGLEYRIWPLYRKNVPVDEIDRVTEFTVPGRTIPMARGANWYIPAVHGVRIQLSDGKEISVTAEHAHLLANALEHARREGRRA